MKTANKKMKTLILLISIFSILIACQEKEPEKMKLIIGKTQEFIPSKEIYIDSVAPGKNYGVVFEIDKETAYFYAVSLDSKNQGIWDALHIFNVKNVKDADIHSTAKIDWSADFRYAILFINDYPHAIFDFQEKQGYNRTEFPNGPSRSGWSQKSKKWNEDILEKFKLS